MREPLNQTAFLQKLLLVEGSEESRTLCEKIHASARTERSLLNASRLVALIDLLGIAGLGYAAVLLPQFFDSSTHMLVRICCALGLASSGSLGIFLTLWLSSRSTSRRLQAEARGIACKLLTERLPGFDLAGTMPVVSEAPELRVDPVREERNLRTAA